VGITSENLPSWMTIAQVAEIFTIAFMLPAVLPIWGVRKTMLLGHLRMARTLCGVRAGVGDAPSRRRGQCGWRSPHSRCTASAMCSSSWWRLSTRIWSPRAMCARRRRRLINVAVLGVGMLIGGFFRGLAEGLFHNRWRHELHDGVPCADGDYRAGRNRVCAAVPRETCRRGRRLVELRVPMRRRVRL
jgi:hypothetical protein